MTIPVIQVERFSYAPDCTLSVVSVVATTFECYGIELPWLENRKGKSCIPVGEYEARTGWHYGEKYDGPSIELLNVPGRTEIEIHPSNVPSELLGCIAPGRRLGALGRERAVLDSRIGFGRLLAVLGLGANYEEGKPLRVHVTDNLLRFRHFPHLHRPDA